MAHASSGDHTGQNLGSDGEVSRCIRGIKSATPFPHDTVGQN